MAVTIGLVFIFAEDKRRQDYFAKHNNPTRIEEHTLRHGHKRLEDLETSGQFDEHTMFDALGDAVIVVDANHAISFINRAAEDLIGLDANSAHGLQYTAVIKLQDEHDKPVGAANDPFAQAVARAGRYSIDDLYIISPKKQKVLLSIVATPIQGKYNDVQGAIAILRDTTAQRALARERDEFISTASHEMRTPVAAIEGYLSMATNPKMAQIDDRARKLLGKAHDATLDLGRLFSDLLTSSRIGDNRISEHVEIFNLSGLAVTVVDQMQPMAEKKGLTLSLRFESKTAQDKIVVIPAYYIYADSERIREVISNLIENGIKYTQHGSVVVSLSADKDVVVMQIADTGMGISATDQKHIFEKFYRVDNAITREVGGTGLGLYISRNLVEHYGGRIWLQSVEHQGSTFGFSLPLARK